MRPLPILSVFLISTLAPAQDWWDTPKRHLTAADYGRFESLRTSTLSSNGRFLAWQVDGVYGDGELWVARVGADGVEGEPRKFEFGSGAKFSKDSKWLAFRIGVSEKKKTKLEKAKKPVPRKIAIVALAGGDKHEVEGVQSYAFSDDSRFLAMHRVKPKDRKKGGADVVVRDLSTGVDTTFGNVGMHAWAEDRALLAMTVDTADKVGNGVRLFDAASGTLRTLDSTDARYRSLTWNEHGTDLAVLRVIESDDDAKGSDDDKEKEGEDKKPKSDAPDAHVVLTWRGLDGDLSARSFDPRKSAPFPANHAIVEHAGLTWSRAGDAVFFGIQEIPEPMRIAQPLEGSLRAELEDPAGVEVWHARDIEIVPRQQVRLSRDEKKNHLCALWLDDGKFVRLGDDLTESIQLVRRQRFALGLDNTPYETEKRFGPTVRDVYLIDTKTGAKDKILARQKYVLGSSPDGRFVAYLKDGAICVFEIAPGVHRNLTGDIAGAEFCNDEGKYLSDEKPPYGIAGWAADGSAMFVHDRWDLWRIATDGSAATRLTKGAEDRVRYRHVVVDPDPEERMVIDQAQPIWVGVYGDRTKKSGYASIAPNGEVTHRLWRDKRISRLVRAKDAASFTFVEEAFDDSPDLFVADASLVSRHQVSATNGAASEFHWGRSELVDYQNEHGEHLQGALYFPADYDPGKRYPVITYIYEKRSQGLHRWTNPSERSAYNTAVFTTNGFFVYQPDIVYRAQNPGLSAKECLVPAVRKLIERNDVDPERIGLVGHSWGAYQTAFMLTHSDVFAAGVAGAPLTNMISMSMSVYWNSGQTNAHIFHESQGRMDQPFWTDLETYVANSPIFGIDDLKSPLLVAFGDKDGAVDWQQGIEFYNAARLAQKPMVMLNYPGENHGLRKKPNQVDYHHRVLSWFQHYLQDKPAPRWILEGQSWMDRKRELKAFDKQKSKRKKPIGEPVEGSARKR